MVSRVPAMSSGRLIAAPAGPERRRAEQGGVPGGAGQQRDGLAEDDVPVTGGRQVGLVAGLRAGEAVQEVVVGVAGDDGLDHRVAAGAGTGGAAGAAAGELVEGDGQLEADGLPGPLRQAVGGDQPGARFLEGVVAALRQGAGVFGAADRGEGVQDGLDGGGAAAGQVAVEPGGAAEGGGEPDRPVVEPVVAGVGGRRGGGAAPPRSRPGRAGPSRPRRRPAARRRRRPGARRAGRWSSR